MHMPLSKQLHFYIGVSEAADLVQYNDRNSCESVLSVWSSESHHCVGFCRQYPVLCTNLDDRGCKCHARRWVNWAAVSQLYWICRNIMQVIIITRLHVMYQQSRKILVFLVVIFLIITSACGVIAAIGSRYTVGGEFDYSRKTWVREAHQTNTRGAHPFRKPSVLLWLSGSLRASGCFGLGMLHCMGGPHTVSFNPDCHTTLPCTACFIDWMDHKRLFDGDDKNSRGLLC